jgi:guanine deaminase
LKALKVIYCNVLNCESDTRAYYLENVAIGISGDLIKFIVPKKETPKLPKDTVIHDFSKMIAMPAFFDMHFHWVQDDVREMAKDNLLDWLKHYTWPNEAKFSQKKYSSEKSQAFAKKMLELGTMGGGCFSSIHTHAVEDALKYFKGEFVVGNVLMTMNSPDYLTQSPREAIDSVKKLATKYKERYAMTPRFAPTTHPHVMNEAAIIARLNKSFTQSHLAETKEEIDYVLALFHKLPGFEKVKTYTEIYERCAILGPKTIMGHGIYLSDSELKMLSKTKTHLAHCPSSNAPISHKGLGSGLFDFEKAEQAKVSWALASDIGAGPYLSMVDVMNSFVHQNKKKHNGATWTKAFYRSTLKGAEILQCEKTHGTLHPKKVANIIFVEKPTAAFQDIEELLHHIFSIPETKREECDLKVINVCFQGNLVK